MATTTSILGGGITINEIHPDPNVDHDGDGTADQNDLYIELFNTSGGSISIAGYEILGFEGGTFGVMHTFAPGTSIAAGERFTVVDSEGGATSITGVSGGSAFSTANLLFGDNTNLFLYDPGLNQYIVIQGSSAAGFFAADQADFLAIHPGAGQVGSTEVTPAVPGSTSPNSFQRPLDGEDSFVSKAASPGTANCFLTGTLIATPTGERKVEDIAIGDRVLTATGQIALVKWNAHQTYRMFERGPKNDPVLIVAGALGDGVPHCDLTVTADHGMVLDGLLVNASALVNGTSIRFLTLAELPGRVTYYHIETEAHDVILANGAPAETFMDAQTRAAFDNFAEYLEHYGTERIIPEMDRPRISSQRLLPDALRTRLGIVESAVEFSFDRLSA